MHTRHREKSHILAITNRRARLRVLGACAALLASACGGGAPPRMAAPSRSYAPSQTLEASAPVAVSGGAAPAAMPSVPVAMSDGAAPAAMPATAGTAQAGSSGAQAAAGAGQTAALQQEQLVVEGWLRIEVGDVAASAAAIRQQIESHGGRLTSEQLDGGATSLHGQVALKIPPGRVPGFLAWLEQHGDVRSKRIQSTDVSRQLFDQALALQNLEHTLSRMHAVLDREGLSMQEILAIENQMTRLRGEIERIKGEKRFLEHRVAFATLTIEIRRPEGEPVILGGRAKAKLYPGPRLSSLVLLDGSDGERLRLGGGLQLRLARQVPLELDIFEDADGTGKGVLATTGGVLYSDFLGRGQRRFLNPYLELRMGYAHVTGHAFAFGAGAGVELFKHKYMQVDVNTRVLGLLGEEFTPALVTGAAVVFAF